MLEEVLALRSGLKLRGLVCLRHMLCSSLPDCFPSVSCDTILVNVHIVIDLSCALRGCPPLLLDVLHERVRNLFILDVDSVPQLRCKISRVFYRIERRVYHHHHQLCPVKGFSRPCLVVSLLCTSGG